MCARLMAPSHLVLRRLLEIKMAELEGPQGTGALEQDEQLLAQDSTAQDGAAALPHRLRCAVVYRAGQKRIIRAHLVGAREVCCCDACCALLHPQALTAAWLQELQHIVRLMAQL